ncbi:MAG TPA: chromate efflux transporter [Terriglobales bacterium]|nr:chromate efflux transporter [Terriglobales bacterium]
MSEPLPVTRPSLAQTVGEVSLKSVALAFLKLGTIAFGGPAAHIAMMEDEFVSRRRWLTREQFLDRLAAANLLPGPSSTEMAIFIGYEKRGWPGLLVAGCTFILPAAIMVGAIAWAYVRYGTLPQVNGVLYALKPVVIAIVVQAFWKLGRTAARTKWLAAVAIVAAVLYATRVHEILTLVIAAGLAAAPITYRELRTRGRVASFLFAQISPARVLGGFATAAAPFGLWRLFLVFAKIGAVLFGSGYVLLAFLRADLVDRLHWLTERQLLDSVAVGQITPGPVFTTATFIGYVIGGAPGAIAATVGIFAPAFIFVAISGFLISRIRRSKIASSMLDGVVVGSLALMGVVAWQLGRAAIIDVPTLVIAIVSAVLLLTFRINSSWLIVAAGVFGWLYRR